MQKSSPPQLSDFQSSANRKSQLRNLCRSGQLFRDRYRILRVLGRGGFGVTFLAQDAALPGSPLCVIKQLSPKVRNPLSLERAKVRFKREARILSQLGSHSQVPMLLDYFMIKGEFFLVQEFVQGDTLAKEVRRSGILSEPKVKQFLQEILPVVRYIHHHRVIHRDIKPPNIIRCRDYQRLVLIDFGAVRECIAEADESGYRAPTTQFVGTMGFAPPEQLALRPTYASDIYALGVTCLFLLTGKSPIEFDGNAKTGELHWQKSVDIGPHFASVLAKMLKPDVRDRYQQVEEVERALQLEPYYSSLSDCLNTQPRANSSFEMEAVTPMDSYLTPIQKRAAAIRSWRSRRKAKESTKPRHGLSNSMSFPL
ncbi:MAG: serine/threonine protein kinase [Leptolyngbya sp. SIO4C5]|uniref:serine/threonine-protein kinase n=1 Tax=Sphaerothrix gracilis TaxID=3151835 RepID=UPI0013C053F4|nr:serine/threonine protein kinase [Leptolyngbya sp. SIO4C5]